MRTKLVRSAIGLALGVGVFGGGFTLGHHWTFGWTMDFLQAETHGNLYRSVEALARLKTGDEAGAITLLEAAVDTATETLPQDRSFSQLPEATRRALQMAKTYRSVYPPAEPSEALSAILDEIPLPEAEYCSPTLQILLQRARAGRTQP